MKKPKKFERKKNLIVDGKESFEVDLRQKMESESKKYNFNYIEKRLKADTEDDVYLSAD